MIGVDAYGVLPLLIFPSGECVFSTTFRQCMQQFTTCHWLRCWRSIVSTQIPRRPADALFDDDWTTMQSLFKLLIRETMNSFSIRHGHSSTPRPLRVADEQLCCRGMFLLLCVFEPGGCSHTWQMSSRFSISRARDNNQTQAVHVQHNTDARSCVQ